MISVASIQYHTITTNRLTTSHTEIIQLSSLMGLALL